MGGQKEDAADPTPVNAWNYMALTDLYDPAADSWRRLDDLNIAREYHAMPILVPDGRVFIVGGEGEPGNEPAASTIEAFTPPYLLRGPRPEMSALTKATYFRGEAITVDVTKTAAPTTVILISSIATTHFMDSGNNRYLELPFSWDGAAVTATIPTAPNDVPVGYYIVFVMVDDIPSRGQIIRVIKRAAPPTDAGADVVPTDAPGEPVDASTDLPAEPPDAGVDSPGVESGPESKGDSAAEALPSDLKIESAAEGGTDAGVDSFSADKPADGSKDQSGADGVDAGAPGATTSGCGCQLASQPGSRRWVLLLALGLVVARRGRRAPGGKKA